MPQAPDWKRVLETGVQFTEVRRSQAHKRAMELVAQGQLARDQLGAYVDELIESSRRGAEELRTVVRTEVQRQLGGLGLATKNDLVALERRLRSSSSAATRAPAKKAAAKKATARKSPAKKATAKKATAKKATAKKATAKKAAKRKPAVKRAR
jgi:polyhydroxyalkanoate synthesis regulator phasin